MKLLDPLPVSVLLFSSWAQAFHTGHVNEGCEIANPFNVPTCDPRACASCPRVSCRGRARAADCAEFGFFGEPVCQGCVCRLRMKKIEKCKKPPSPEEEVAVEAKAKKPLWPIPNKKRKTRDSL